MPGYREHLSGGMVVFFVSVAIIVHWCVPTLLTLVEWGLCTLAGSLFPDIDTKSKGQRYFYWILLGVMCALIATHRYKALAFTSIMAMIPLIVHHRGLCHRWWFVIVVPLAVAHGVSLLIPGCTYMLLWDAAFFSLGALSHLWLDLGWRRMMRW